MKFNELAQLVEQVMLAEAKKKTPASAVKQNIKDNNCPPDETTGLKFEWAVIAQARIAATGQVEKKALKSVTGGTIKGTKSAGKSNAYCGYLWGQQGKNDATETKRIELLEKQTRLKKELEKAASKLAALNGKIKKRGDEGPTPPQARTLDELNKLTVKLQVELAAWKELPKSETMEAAAKSALDAIKTSGLMNTDMFAQANSVGKITGISGSPKTDIVFGTQGVDPFYKVSVKMAGQVQLESPGGAGFKETLDGALTALFSEKMGLALLTEARNASSAKSADEAVKGMEPGLQKLYGKVVNAIGIIEKQTLQTTDDV